MRDDLELIIKEYPSDMNVLRVYAIGDVHVGSPEFDEKAIRKKIRIIEEDPNAAVVLCGDLADYGLKNSKTNVYLQTMSPRVQQEFVYELFLPICHKLSAVVPGNHEERITKEIGTSPLYDLCVRWGMEEVYRENMAITKYIFGKWESQKDRNSFIGVTVHGTTKNKNHKFFGCIDNVDFSISGHTHTPSYSPSGRIRVSSNRGTASHVPYKELVVDAHLKVGGYGLKKEYEVPPPPELQYLELSSYREPTRARERHRVMDYHAVQI